MYGNLNLYDFNGSVRRNKLQEAMMQDLAQKDQFMKRIESERNERHRLQKKRAAAIKIQAAFRRYITRKKFHNFLREKFDEAGKACNIASLESQITRLTIFFKQNVDSQRVSNLCADALPLFNCGVIEKRKRQQLIRCVIATWSDFEFGQAFIPTLRFFELFLDEDDGRVLIECGYHSAVITLFARRHSLPAPLYAEDSLPMSAKSILDFLLLPILRCKSMRLELLFGIFIAFCTTLYQLHVISCVVPFIGNVFKEKKLAISDLTRSLSDNISIISDIDSSKAAMFSYCILRIVSYVTENLTSNEMDQLLLVTATIVQKIFVANASQSKIDASDFDEEMDVEAASTSTTPDLGTFERYLRDVTCMIVTLLSSSVASSHYSRAAVNSDSRISSLCTLAYFVRMQSPDLYVVLINLFFSQRILISCLWSFITSLKKFGTALGAKSKILYSLQNGENISQMDEHQLLPAISLFVTLLGKILQAVDDDDFQNGGGADSVFPLSLEQVADVAFHCRDLTLGLIDLAFPVATASIPANNSCVLKNSKWSDVFQSVALFTKALNERDNRIHFLPDNFWSNHNRRVVVNSTMWKVERGKRMRRMRPFEFVRLFLEDSDDDAEPPSSIELRNITILRKIPFVVPFMQRIEIFTELLRCDEMRSESDDNHRDAFWLVVHRSTLYEDAFAGLSPHKVPDLRKPIRIRMINWAGMDEAGVDGGGIFREFLSELLQTALDPNRGFFSTTHDQLLYPNPSAPLIYSSNFEDHYYFIGRIIAKLIFEGLLVDIRFAEFFLQQLMSGSGDVILDLELVKSFDPLLHANLKYLKQCKSAEVDSLLLDFSVLVENLGVTEKVELKRDGSNIRVTTENRMEYIALYVNYFLSKRLAPMINALRAGLRNVLEPGWLQMFSASELSMLISGVDSVIDFSELKKFTTVYNMQTDYDHLYVDTFWLVINEMPAADKSKLLKFITGCPRPPIMGFKTLTPPMGIHLVRGADKLPTAATCMNFLKLPVYPDTKTLREKLNYAINAGAGFELS